MQRLTKIIARLFSNPQIVISLTYLVFLGRTLCHISSYTKASHYVLSYSSPENNMITINKE